MHIDKQKKISAIIPAAGSGSRYSKIKNKLLEKINGKPVIIHTLEKISGIREIEEIIICTSSDLIKELQALINKYNIPKVSNIIIGGSTRQESVYNGLKACNEPYLVLIHDGARPLISKSIINEVIKTAKEKGSSIVAVTSKDTIKKVDNDLKVINTPDRSHLWNVQTPQVFNYNELLKAHKLFKNIEATDDSILIEKIGKPVYITKGDYKNIKITTQEDIHLATMFLNSKQK